jgi:2-succinyl-6-hydroxy-2,4-cyclohexadiene-1-carboxylate synthase
MSALVFLHGFTGSPRNFQALIAESPLGTRVYAPALLGHDGEEAAAASADGFEAEVDRLAAEIEERGLGPVHVVGYSLGARIALGLSVRHPQLVARATWIGVNPGLRNDAERADRRAADAKWCELLEREGIPAFVDAWERQPLFATQHELPRAVLEAQRHERLRHAAAGLSLALKHLGLAAMPNYWPHLEHIDVPVDLVTGEHDEKFSALARAASEHLPDARLHSVRGAGHNVLLEQPRAIAALIGGAT